jgi:oligopeptide transport system substrate-binding protein
MNRKQLLSMSGLVVASSLILAACAQPAAPAPQVIKETVVVEVEKPVEKVVEATVIVEATAAPTDAAKVLRVNIGTYPDVIDPQKSSFVNEIAHLTNIYEGLTRLDAKLATVPAAAEKWEYNDDATELAFTLRPDLKYSDGTPLNAKRFEYSIIRNINPATAGQYAAITNEIAGAADWQDKAAAAGAETDEAKKKALEEEVAAAEATVRASVQALDASGAPCADYEQADCLTLKLKLAKPAPYFHTVLGLWVTFPAKEELIAEGGDDWWQSSKYQIGNGPYILKTLEPAVRGYFVPNPNYWGDKTKTDVEFSYITDTAVAFQAYKNNEFDIVGLAAEDLKSAQADPTLSKDINIYPGSCTFALQFRNFTKPFDDPKVREAFTYALDRERWVKDILQDLGAPTLTWIPPGFPGFKEGETRFAYDPEKAMAALAESTYKTVDALPNIVLSFSDTPRNRTRNEWLAARFKEVFGDGLKIELNPVEATAMTALTKDKESNLAMYTGGWCADYPDPQNWLSVFFHGSSVFADRIGFNDEEFNKLTEQADVELDPAKRADLYQQAQDRLVEANPVAFFYNNVNSYLVKPWVTGIQKTPQDPAYPGAVTPQTIDIDTSMLP